MGTWRRSTPGRVRGLIVVGPLEPARLDPRLTFEHYVVGEGNRLAVAASRRAAESPGAHYNPLFLYSASGLGKSHLLHAMAHHAMSVSPTRRIFYQSPEVYLAGLARALEAGVGDETLAAFRKTDLLLLDDVQFLAGQPAAQEMLLRTLDALTASGAQVVLASDRPPSEIDALDARLLSRFSGGLLVDIGDPDYATRVTILRQKATDRGATLGPGIAEALARPAYRSVRALQGTLNRVLAIQDLEGRILLVGDLAEAVGPQFEGAGDARIEPATGSDGVQSGVHGGVQDGARVGSSADLQRTQLTRIVGHLEQAGYRIKRLAPLKAPLSDRPSEPGADPRGHPEGRALSEGWRSLLEEYRSDVEQMRAIEAELQDLGNPWVESAAALMRDPDLVSEAQALLERVRRWANPFIQPGAGPRLDKVSEGVPPLARDAVWRALEGGGAAVNPILVHSATSGRARGLLEGAVQSHLDLHPLRTLVSFSAAAFADGFVEAVAEGILPQWRERWGRAEVVLLHLQETLPFTERVQEEFFHLYEALERSGRKLLISSERPPRALGGVQERLISRFEGGLVMDLDAMPPSQTS